MAKATKAPKAEATITAPAITEAYLELCKVGVEVEATARKAVIALGVAMTASKLSVRDARKAIEATGQKSSIIKVSQIEALPTFVILDKKHKEFREKSLAKGLTFATATYKLGADRAKNFTTFKAIESAIKDYNTEKHNKATGKAPKEGKAPASIESTARKFLQFVGSLDATKLTDEELDVLVEINLALSEIGADIPA